MQKVAPAAPVAPWLGGKRALHRRIIARIDAIPHQTYAEPFVGMGGVFLRRAWRPKCEVANDLKGEITNLFRILQRHYPQLMEVMRFQITSRREFERLRATDPATLTDLERAARFLYLQRLAFGGKLGGVFGVSRDHPARFSLARLETLLEEAHERLDGVVFENLDWADLIARYDGAGTLFYLDPPYWGGEGDYGRELFSRAQFARMAELLAGIKGAFILSINDRPEVRALFADFRCEEVGLSYSVAQGGATEARELILSNREIRMGLL
ncbi:DNA adenine methylase [Pseudooceanicola sp. CBS1P-1]|uniref:site-specific DNA-methyltransferase (adenine-specific) n=1 Tax=Pseudooceanicola albus TaxID=2692189 RepID=A0A6L7GAZ6_9RHOB|nr:MULTISPECIES: DNA adenine methylase [Pseudooceanicola]MBT9386885.1 DNA adenine methylase [Pseudooceanicola endophyticus]MXN21225.1 DNA adenine methylase [Pseudooceanicola albus]